MENFLNLTPLQSILILVLNGWILIVFPVMVIRKLNYMTYLLESQFDDSTEQENQP